MNLRLRPNRKPFFLFLFICVGLAQSIHAQQGAWKDYVLLSGNGGTGTTNPGSLGYGVVFSSSGTGSAVNGGIVGAYSMIKTTGANNFNTSLYSRGQISLGNLNTVTGRISAANLSNLSGTIFSSGLLSQLSGKIDVKGNIVVSSGTVSNTVTHPVGTTYSGPAPGANVTANPTLQTIPSLPAVTPFPAAGVVNITNSMTLNPGSYGSMSFTGKTITFNGPGTYVFSAINLTNINTFNFDFQNKPNNANGIFRIYVHGNANLAKIYTNLVNGGSASRIFFESHGNGIGSPTGKDAVTIGNLSTIPSGTGRFYGTIWAPYAAVNIGQGLSACQYQGAIYSATQVSVYSPTTITYAPFYDCANVSANAGPDTTIVCGGPTLHLQGVASFANAQYAWSTPNGVLGADSNTANPTVVQFGTFVLKVTEPASGCVAIDTVLVNFIPCIVPGYAPPAGGKETNIIGPDLTWLNTTFNPNNTAPPNEDIFVVKNDSVWVEIIYNDGMYTNLYNLITAPPFNASQFIDNGVGNRILTTLIRYAELDELNNLNQTSGLNIINYVRPLYRPITSGGVAYTKGDVAQKTNLARAGFDTRGEGIKIGVISNSFNTQPGNPAHIDVLNGDLPGPGNPDSNFTPVQVVDYPGGAQSDEGRAMLQIIHDIAPKSELMFRTGFISAGNMAQGIRDLKQSGCQIEVDDISYVTEPFFRDGLIAQAVNEVKAQGVTYFTSAGNYGDRSYEGIFNPVPAPAPLSGSAHNFSNGDIYQSISLTPGNYLVVLQWEDDFYSINQNQNGTQNDLDIYLTYDNGVTLFGCNRSNLNGDPIEVLPFTVSQNTNSNILITRSAGTGNNIHFKYIFFRGAPTFNEYHQGSSTIVGQANATGAITLGAVLYSNTPPFGVTPATKASFSSTGGTLVNGVARQKPDLCAPNGGNTTVNLGGPDIEGDSLPNFFGTSAAAPHAAGAAALIMSAHQKFYNTAMTPDQVRNLLINHASDMYTPGFDFLSGYGLLDADACIRTFANPEPVITSLDIPPGITPGDTTFTLTIHGQHLSTETNVYVRNDTIPTNYVSDSVLTATIPPFDGNPSIHVCTPSMTPVGGDGGCSDTMYFFSPVKKEVVVNADNKSKKYGEALPQFTVHITVDGVPLDSTSYTLAELGLDSLTYQTPANVFSTVGLYFIKPIADVSAQALQELFHYSFVNGILTVNKMPIVITPEDKTVTFGDQIDGRDIQFRYHFDSAYIPPALLGDFIDSIRLAYEPTLIKQVVLIDDRDEFNDSTINSDDILNLSFLSGSRGIANGSRGIVNGSRGIVNGVADTTYVIDLPYQSVVEYNQNGGAANLYDSCLITNGSRGIANGSRGIVNGSRGIVNSASLVDGSALVNGSRGIANGSRAVANGSRGIANGSRGIVNAEVLDGVNNSNSAVIIHEEDLDTPEDTNATFELYAVNAITGLTAGTHYIIPGSFMAYNYSVTYGLGHLNVQPYEIKIQSRDTSTTYGTPPFYTIDITGYQYDDVDSFVFDGALAPTPVPGSPIPAGTHTIHAGGLTLKSPSNYFVTYVDGTLQVDPASLTVTADNQSRPYGFSNPPLTFQYNGFKYNDNESSLTTAPSAQTTAQVSSLPGNYPITVGGGFSPNYLFSYQPGQLTIGAAPSCTIQMPPAYSFCHSGSNTIDAVAPANYLYSWSVAGAGWSIDGGGNTTTASYTSGNSGVSGQFQFNVYAPQTNYLVATCSLAVSNICYPEYCTYTEAYWSNPSATDCAGVTPGVKLPSLLTFPLVNGSGSRTVTFGVADANCLMSKLPAGSDLLALPTGNYTCPTLNYTNYLGSNGKLKNRLLGKELALALSVRNYPALGQLNLEGEYMSTFQASSCVNGEMIPGTMQIVNIPTSVLNYLGNSRTVNDLLALANQSLGGALPAGAPSMLSISDALDAILNGFDHCRILYGFNSMGNTARTTQSPPMDQTIDLIIYPNPSSGQTTVAFPVFNDQEGRLEVFDLKGALLGTLYENKAAEDGHYSLQINASVYGTGVFMVRYTSGKQVTVKKLVIID